MRKPLAILGAVAGSALGWWLGSFIGIMTAFILSMVGTGFGIYVGARMARHYFL